MIAAFTKFPQKVGDHLYIVKTLIHCLQKMLWDFIGTISHLCYLICGRDLHAMIQATAPNPSPSSHSSHIFNFTDLSAPLSNNSNVSFESPSKKRKFGNSEVECSTLPVSFASESIHTQVHKIIKKECEELIELIVHLSILIIFLFVHSESIQDQAKLWITVSLSNLK